MTNQCNRLSMLAIGLFLTGACVPMTDTVGNPVGGNDQSTDNGSNDTSKDSENVGGDDNDNLVLFEDPDSDFSTTDVFDTDRESVRFDAALRQMIWAKDGQRFDGWEVAADYTLSNGFFTIRFGSENGKPMAYFTETNPQTICDIAVNGQRVSIFATSETVPQN